MNKHMSATCGEEGMVYTYKMQEGVSKVKGGVEVLRELEYPESVLKAAETTVSELCI
jgi:DNA mismatch repair ATPase MutS